MQHLSDKNDEINDKVLKSRIALLPPELVSVISQFAASPQPAELCRDIKSYIYTLDLMYEFYVYKTMVWNH